MQWVILCVKGGRKLHFLLVFYEIWCFVFFRVGDLW